MVEPEWTPTILTRELSVMPNRAHRLSMKFDMTVSVKKSEAFSAKWVVSCMESATEIFTEQFNASVSTTLMVLLLKKYILSPQMEVLSSLLKLIEVMSVVIMGDCLTPSTNIRIELGRG